MYPKVVNLIYHWCSLQDFAKVSKHGDCPKKLFWYIRIVNLQPFSRRLRDCNKYLSNCWSLCWRSQISNCCGWPQNDLLEQRTEHGEGVIWWHWLPIYSLPWNLQCSEFELRRFGWTALRSKAYAWCFFCASWLLVVIVQIRTAEQFRMTSKVGFQQLDQGIGSIKMGQQVDRLVSIGSIQKWWLMMY